MSRPPSVTLLGTPAHPVLTDVPVTLLSGAPLLELVGTALGREPLQRAARVAWVGAAIAAAPTALTGYLDYRRLRGDTRSTARRHAILNASAVSTGLLAAACRGRDSRGLRGLGAAAAVTSAGLASLGAHLGGELVYRSGVAVEPAATTGAGAIDAAP